MAKKAESDLDHLGFVASEIVNKSKPVVRLNGRVYNVEYDPDQKSKYVVNLSQSSDLPDYDDTAFDDSTTGGANDDDFGSSGQPITPSGGAMNID